MPIRIILVDDHPIVLEGLTLALCGHSDISVEGTASDSDGLFSLLEETSADVILLDLTLPGLQGTEITRMIRKRNPEIKVIILTANTDDSSLRESLAAGASGYLSKTSGVPEILHAILEIHAGREYVGRTIADTIVGQYIHDKRLGAQTADPDPLSTREKEIVRLLASGLSARQIGEKLFISPRTVETHRNHIMEKLLLKTLPDLVKYAIRKGLSEG